MMKMMKIYVVKYVGVDMDQYFGGSNEYYEDKVKYFATKEEAEKFVNEKVVAYTWDNGKQMIDKEAGEGKIVEIEIE